MWNQSGYLKRNPEYEEYEEEEYMKLYVCACIYIENALTYTYTVCIYYIIVPMHIADTNSGWCWI